MSRIFVFGEVLFDVYPDSAVIGGAPFNFCAHAAKLGEDTVFLSAVGADPLGEQVREQIRKFQIDDTFLQITAAPTGICRVTLSEDKLPSYHLLPHQAYDNITLAEQQLAEIRKTAGKCLYFGTLAEREPVSEETFEKLLACGNFEQIIYDVNIRQRFYNRKFLACGLSQATILKFSREESGVFAELGLAEEREQIPLCRELAAKYPNLQLILLTLDRDGAMVYDTKADRFDTEPAAPGPVVSTVGAGDSFTAGFVHAFLRGRPAAACLKEAVILSGYVVGHLDAIPEYDEHLKMQLAR